MGFKKPYNSILFAFIGIFFLFGVANYMLIGDYVTIPKSYEIENYTYGLAYHNKYINTFPDYWTIAVGDGKITNIENIIICIFNLWGFLRILDLTRHFEKL